MNTEFNINSLLLFIIALMEAVILHLYYIYFLGEKIKSKSIYAAALLMFFLTNSFLSTNASGTKWITLFTYFFCFLYPIVLFSGTILQRLFAAGLIIALGTITETVSIFFVSWISFYPFPSIPTMDKLYFMAAFGSKLLLLLTVLFITKIKKTEFLRISISRLALLLSVVLICTFLSYVNITLTMQHGVSITLIQLLAEISIFILSVLVFYIYERLLSASKKELHAKLLTKQLEQDIRYFKHMDSYLCEIRSLKHDFTSHLTSMRLLLNKKNYLELENYMDKYLQTVHSVISEIITSLPSVDTIISFKKAIACEQGIEFIIYTESISDIFINPVHLNIILSNLLDNAIQACLLLPNIPKRKIELLLKMEHEFLYIKVKNSSVPVYFNEGTLPKTTKPDKEHHGLGLEAIRRLIIAYQGILSCEYSNGNFIFTARLKNIDSFEDME